MRAGADLRLLRAAVLSAAGVLMAATGHARASDVSVPTASLLGGWVLLLALTTPLTGRERRSLPAIAAVLTAAQVGLHALFSLGQHSGGGQSPRALAAMLLCNDHAAALSDADARQLLAHAGLSPHGSADQATAAGPGSLADAPMLLGHLCAALAAGWLLRRGEAALWQLVHLSLRVDPAAASPLPPPLRRALRLLRRGWRTPPAPDPRIRRVRTAPHPTAATHGTVLANAVHRRGPPHTARQFALTA